MGRVEPYVWMGSFAAKGAVWRLALRGHRRFVLAVASTRKRILCIAVLVRKIVHLRSVALRVCVLVLRDGIDAEVQCVSPWIETPNTAVLAAKLVLRMRCAEKVHVCRIVGVLCSVVG